MPEPSKLAAALAKVQGDLKPIKRNAKGARGKYADLATVEDVVFPLLSRNDLAFIAKPTVTSEGRFVLAYSLVHGPSGERENGEYPMHGAGTDQQRGSEITYARRYALCAITGAAPEGEDDDGEGASRRRQPMDKSRNQEGRVKVPVPGPDHERLRQEPPMNGQWDGEDHWKDQPPGQFDAPPPKDERRGSSRLTPAQTIAVHFKRLGVTDDTERLVKTTILAGRAELLEHTSDLDEAKQIEIRDELSRLRDRAALDRLLDARRAEVPS